MSALQLAFVAINLIVPYWIWRSSSHNSILPIEWKRWEPSMARVLSANGGFSCSLSDVMKDLKSLCEKSDEKYSEKATAVFEQILGDSLLSCEVRRDGISVQISRPEETSDLSCMAKDSWATFAHAPTFLFSHSGALSSISFTNSNGERQDVTIQNCREMLKHANSYSLANTDFKMCVVYDPAPRWNSWRRKLQPAD